MERRNSMAYWIHNFPYTENGKRLNLSEEQQKKSRLVYKKIDEKKWKLHEVWNPRKKYGEDDIIVPLQSTFAGVCTIRPCDYFANVIGSTYDPKAGTNTWIELLRIVYSEYLGSTKSLEKCCTDSFMYYEGGQFERINCSNTIVGGHVIFKTHADKVKPGEEIALAPICSQHNFHKRIGYMKVKENTLAVILDNYLVCSSYQDYLAPNRLCQYNKV